MGIESASLSLRLDAGPDADDEELQKLGQRLRNELLELDVDSVDFERHGSAPGGAKGDPITLGALAISLGPVALTAMLNMVQSWLKRHQEATVSM